MRRAPGRGEGRDPRCVGWQAALCRPLRVLEEGNWAGVCQPWASSCLCLSLQAASPFRAGLRAGVWGPWGGFANTRARALRFAEPAEEPGAKALHQARTESLQDPRGQPVRPKSPRSGLAEGQGPLGGVPGAGTGSPKPPVVPRAGLDASRCSVASWKLVVLSGENPLKMSM